MDVSMKDRLRGFLNRLDEYSKSSPVLLALSGRIRQWRGRHGRLMIIPKEANFDILFYTREPIPWSFESKDKFIAQVTLVPEEMMNSFWSRVYKRLKPLECELVWKGVFRKRAIFRPYSGLRFLAEYIEGLKPDGRLSRALASASEVIKLLGKLKPGELIVNLKSMTEVDSYLASDPEMLKHMQAMYYENPQEIIWYITFTTMLIRGPRYKEKVITIYDLLNRVAVTVRRISEEIAKEISS